MNLLRVCLVSDEVSYEHRKNFLNQSFFVYKFPPINCLADLDPNFRYSIYHLPYQREICLYRSSVLSVLNRFDRIPVDLMH